MPSPTAESNAVRTVTLSLLAWGVLATALAFSRVFEGEGVQSALVVAFALTALAGAAYAVDAELRDAARASARTVLVGWALAFDVAALALLGLAATSAAPLALAIWKGLPAMAPLFAVPLAAVFHAAAFDAAPGRGLRLSAPARSRERSPAAS